MAPDLVFDLDPGNIFVSRLAGNSVDTGSLGSTEYAVAVLGVKLIMVLGHSDCGAVEAAIGVASGEASFPRDRFGAIGAVVDGLVPSVERVPKGKRTLPRYVSAHAAGQARELAGRGPIVKQAVEAGDVRVVGAVYDIGSRRVRLL